MNSRRFNRPRNWLFRPLNRQTVIHRARPIDASRYAWTTKSRANRLLRRRLFPL